MNGYLPGMESEHRKPELSQWFTPPGTALCIVQFAFPGHYDRMLSVLEPSAGRGALVRAIADNDYAGMITAVDIDPANREALMALHAVDTLIIGDFLKLEELHHFDVAIMNPPFEAGQTEQHIMHALKFCDRVVCHCPLTTLAGQERREKLWSQVELTRIAICSTRPRYGIVDGHWGGKTDMCTIEVRPVKDVAVHFPAVEFWP